MFRETEKQKWAWSIRRFVTGTTQWSHNHKLVNFALRIQIELLRKRKTFLILRCKGITCSLEKEMDQQCLLAFLNSWQKRTFGP